MICHHKWAILMAEAIATVLSSRPSFELLEISNPYPCRPPRDGDSRVYVKLLINAPEEN